MLALTMSLERPWEQGDPEEVCFFGRADILLQTMEARDIQIRIEDELLDLIELSIAQTFDGDWAWMAGVDECGGVAHSREAARAIAEAVGWDFAVARIRDLVMSKETTIKLHEIARRAALGVRGGESGDLSSAC
ncbi:hypothetical protein C3Y89_24295 [Rhizobium sp. UPM1132]|nr:hypothetical protein [Rhizobium ruizarguesonis]